MKQLDEPNELDELGALDKLAEGGQGTIFRAARMPGELYKRYLDPTQLNVGELKRLIRRVHIDLHSEHARRTILESTAWPTGTVMENGRCVGMMMPEAPPEFSTRIGGKSRLKELQFLIFGQKAGWREVRLPDFEQRRELVLGYVRLFKALHDADIVIGDVSPRNLLWTLEPQPKVYAIDCDGFRIHGYPAATPQAQTPDWVDPDLEAGNATFDSDRFKLALLVLRTLLTEPKVTPQEVVADPERLYKLGDRVAPLAVRVAGGERCHAVEWLRALDNRPTIQFDPPRGPRQGPRNGGRPAPPKEPDRPVLKFD